MAITKVWIEEGCISCGLCAITCPQVFAMPELAEVIAGADFAAYAELIKEAAAACPADVIRFE